MKSPLSRAARARIRLAYLRELSRFENALQKRVARIISKQGETLAWYYRSTHVVDRSQFHEHRQEFVDLLTQFYRRAGITFGEKVARSLKSSAFEQVLLEWIKRQALQTVDDIDDRTLEIVRSVIARGTTDEVDVAEIAQLIEDATDVDSDSARARARTIARTEMHAAMNFAQVESAKATGLQLVKTWTANLDGRTRESHAEADGQTVPLDQPFVVDGESIDRPGDGSPENSINCRCTVCFSEVQSAVDE